MSIRRRWDPDESSDASMKPLPLPRRRYDVSSEPLCSIYRNLLSFESTFHIIASDCLRSESSWEDAASDSSSTFSSTSDSDSSGSEKGGVGHVGLSIATLQSMHALSSLQTEEMSTFAQQGISKKRIKVVLKSGACSCKCTMPQNELEQVCQYFWRLPKTAQDAVLWSIQSECSQRRRQWYLQGLLLLVFNSTYNKNTSKKFQKHTMTSTLNTLTKGLAKQKAALNPLTGHALCKEAWMRFLGVGSDRISRCKRNHQGLDKRTLTCGGGLLAVTVLSINNLVCHTARAPRLYRFHLRASSSSCIAVGINQGLLHAFILVSWRMHDDIVAWLEIPHVTHYYSFLCDAPGYLPPVTNHHSRIASGSLIEASDQQLRENILQKLVDQRLMGATVQINFNAEPAKLPMRELPHGSFANLYLLYCAFCRMMGEPPAGKTLFYQASQEWRCCLRFHKKTTHQMCKTCSILRAAIQNATES